MAQRSFVDADGVEWLVYDVIAQGDLFNLLKTASEKRNPAPDRFTEWLCFESREPQSRKRRLSPIPEEWRNASVDELRRFLTEARPALSSSSLPDQL